MTGQAVWLLAGLFFAHFLGDFTPLATARMQVAKVDGGPLIAIAAHGAVHACLVAIVVTLIVTPAWPLVAAAFGIELATHFGLDVAKARLGRRFPSLNDRQQNPFWFVLGLDQLGHALVLLGIAALLL